MNARRWILAIGLLTSVAVAIRFSGDGDDSDVVAAAPMRSHPVSHAHTDTGAAGLSAARPVAQRHAVEREPLTGKNSDSALIALQPRHFETDSKDLFAVPQDDSPVHQLVVKPSAPPMPFRMLGRMTDGDRQAVLLAGGGSDETLAHEGDTVGGSYRLDAIQADALVFTYLPLKTRQTLTLGSDHENASDVSKGTHP